MPEMEFLVRGTKRLPEDSLNRPMLAALCREITESAANRDIKEMKPAFDKLLASGECFGLLNKVLTDLANDPFNQLPSFEGNSIIGAIFTVFRSENYVLALHAVEPEGPHHTTVVTSGSDYIMGVVNDVSSVRFTNYRCPESVDISVFDPNAKFIETPCVSLVPHETSVFYYKNDLPVLTREERTVFLRLSKLTVSPYYWTFDRVTLTPLYIRTTVPATSRLRIPILLAEALHGNFGTDEKWLTILDQLTRSPYHYIRWKAIRALYKLKQDAGVAALREAVNDPHPYVRKAAMSSLARIDG